MCMTERFANLSQCFASKESCQSTSQNALFGLWDQESLLSNQEFFQFNQRLTRSEKKRKHRPKSKCCSTGGTKDVQICQHLRFNFAAWSLIEYFIFQYWVCELPETQRFLLWFTLTLIDILSWNSRRIGSKTKETERQSPCCSGPILLNDRRWLLVMHCAAIDLLKTTYFLLQVSKDIFTFYLAANVRGESCTRKGLYWSSNGSTSFPVGWVLGERHVQTVEIIDWKQNDLYGEGGNLLLFTCR